MERKISYLLKAVCNIAYGIAYFSAIAFAHIMLICTAVMYSVGIYTPNSDMTVVVLLSLFIVMTHWFIVAKRQPIPFPFEVEGKYDWLPKVTWCAILFSISSLTFAQQLNTANIEKIDNEFIVKTKKTPSNYVKTKYKWTIVNGETSISYEVFINTKSGRCIYYKISKNTDKPYPVYLPHEIAKEIAKEYGIEYTPPKLKKK